MSSSLLSLSLYDQLSYRSPPTHVPLNAFLVRLRARKLPLPIDDPVLAAAMAQTSGELLLEFSENVEEWHTTSLTAWTQRDEIILVFDGILSKITDSAAPTSSRPPLHLLLSSVASLAATRLNFHLRNLMKHPPALGNEFDDDDISFEAVSRNSSKETSYSKETKSSHSPKKVISKLGSEALDISSKKLYLVSKYKSS